VVVLETVMMDTLTGEISGDAGHVTDKTLPWMVEHVVQVK